MKPIPVVCINVGSKYEDLYVQRLANMVARHLSVPHRLVAFVDRPHQLERAIEQRDASGWGVTGWFNKLKLFDPSVMDEEFLFLDLALVIRSSLDPMAEFAASSSASLIGMRDWNYDCFGSMVMWVRPDPFTQGIWEAYVAGKRYPTKTAVDGDQDFIDAYVTENWPAGRLDHFPQEWFASYKALRSTHVRDRSAARKMLEAARFVKFHGPPKMHQLLDGRSHARILLEQKPLRFIRYWNYLRPEVREWWR